MIVHLQRTVLSDVQRKRRVAHDPLDVLPLSCVFCFVLRNSLSNCVFQSPSPATLCMYVCVVFSSFRMLNHTHDQCKTLARSRQSRSIHIRLVQLQNGYNYINVWLTFPQRVCGHLQSAWEVPCGQRSKRRGRWCVQGDNSQTLPWPREGSRTDGRSCKNLVQKMNDHLKY